MYIHTYTHGIQGLGLEGTGVPSFGLYKSSRARVLKTLFTAQTRLVLQTATYRRQKRSTQTYTKPSTP